MSRRSELGVGCLLLVSLAVTGVMALQIGARAPWSRTVDVVVPAADPGQLSVGAPVKAIGVRVGEVSSLELDDDHGMVLVHLALEPEPVLTRGTEARLRPASLLGEWYVELIPGAASGEPLVDGDRLPPVGERVEIDELVAALGPIVGAIDADDVGAAMERLREALDEDPDRLVRMLEDVETMADNGAAASEELPALLDEARQTLRAARGTVGRLDARVREAEAVLARGDRVLAKLEEAGEPLPETVEEARAALEDSRRLLADLEASTADIDDALEALSSLNSEEIERILRDVGIRIRIFARKGDVD